jgi:hypothetical protein
MPGEDVWPLVDMVQLLDGSIVKEKSGYFLWVVFSNGAMEQSNNDYSLGMPSRPAFFIRIRSAGEIGCAPIDLR